jgi:hypothetical protein
MARVLIGTSGWHYDSWRGRFYPEGLPIKAQLQYYASQFEAAELNGVFYRTPTPDAVKSWKEQTGKNFRLHMEGVEIHYPLEAAVGELGEQPRVDGEPSVVTWRKGRSGSFSIATQLQGRRGPPIRISAHAFAEKTIQHRISASQLVFATNHAPALGG